MIITIGCMSCQFPLTFDDTAVGTFRRKCPRCKAINTIQCADADQDEVRNIKGRLLDEAAEQPKLDSLQDVYTEAEKGD